MPHRRACPYCGMLVVAGGSSHRCEGRGGAARKPDSAIRSAPRKSRTPAAEPEAEYVVNEAADEVDARAILPKLSPQAARLLRRAIDDPFAGQDVSPELRAVVERECTRGERILFSLRPSVDAYLASFGILRYVMASVLLVLGTLVAAGGIAIALLLPRDVPVFVKAILCGMTGLFAAFCLGFGLFFSFLGPLGRRFRSRWSLYVVTDRRCMVARGSSVQSYSGRNIERMLRLVNPRRPGAGGLAFSSFQSRDWLSGRIYFGFLDIDDVAAVEEIVRAAILG